MDQFTRTTNIDYALKDALDIVIPDESSLIEKAKQNPLAFGELFDKYHDLILNYCIHRTANVSLSQELTSNTFFKALDKLWTFKWRSIPFSAWLYRIASNEINEYYRKRKKYIHVNIESFEDKFPDESSADKEILENERRIQENQTFILLHQELSKLKVKYQEVLILRFFEDKSIKEISEITKKSEGTIKSLIHRGIEKLRTQLDISIFEG